MCERPILAMLAAALLVGGCSGSSGTTGALLAGGQQPPAPPASDPTSRALQVGATSARASRCGFYFDPNRLRQQFLAAESALGAPPEQIQKIEREYDYTRAAVAQSTAQDPAYCSQARTAIIKADLGRHLAGDFSPPPKKPEAEEGLFGGLASSSEPKPFRGTFNDLTGKPE